MRNFGLPNVTSRPKLGAPSTGSHLREELTRNSIQLPDNPTSRQANSGRGNAAPFSLDVRERAVCFFILFFVTLVCSIVLASYVALSSLNLD